MDEPQAHIYEFGDFRVDASKRLLLKGDGEIVRLTPKVFDTLLYLVEHSGKIIEKDELMREIWADTIVEENNLSQNISILRRVLGEKRGEHRFIATIPGRGFRFIPKVCVIDKAVTARKAEEESQPTPPDRLLSRKAIRQPRIWLAIITGIIIVGLGIMAFDSRRTKPAPPAQIKSIAVLPFKPLVLENRDEAFEMGITDDLISKLGANREITVPPLSAVRRYGNLEQDVVQAGIELGVDSVLDGSIQVRGENIRVKVRLIRVADGTPLWTKPFDEKFTNIYDAQDSISQKVAAALNLRLKSDEKSRSRESQQAFYLYHTGRIHWLTHPEKGFEQSADFFQQAIDVDPNFALPYAGLAEYYGFAAVTGRVPSDEYWLKSETAANKALELDNELPDAYNALAGVKQFFRGDWQGAERDLKRAIELNHNYAEGHYHYGAALMEFGRLDEALAHIKKALELEPRSLRYNRALGIFFYRTRDYDRAVEQYRKTLETHLNDADTHARLGDAYEQKQMPKEAVAEWSKALTLRGDEKLAVNLERVYAASGFNAAVRYLWQERLEEINEQVKRGEYVAAMHYVHAYARLKDKERALAWLVKAEREHNGLILEARFEPAYDGLRDDPRFQDSLQRVGLPQ